MSSRPPPPLADSAGSVEPRLKRDLAIRDLVIYGLVLIQPIAPVGIFGIAAKISEGHVATTILIAMVAMSLTAFSYGRMAALYPSAGSAYTYVGQALGRPLGFFAGWAMLLDYLVIPLINVVYCSLTLQRLIPAVPYAVWAVVVTLLMTGLNLRAVRVTARANSVLLWVMCGVIVCFVALSIRHLVLRSGWAGLFSLTPFYNPETFKWGAVATGTSLAALTYIGFDGVTTLAEEVRNPRRSVPIATVLVCVLTGIFSLVEVYLAQLIWPDYGTFANPETAFMDVTRVVGGAALFQAMGLVLVLACLGSGMSGQTGLARLLFSMGRDGLLPRRFFGHLSPGTSVPTYNVIVTGVICLCAALWVPYQNAAELLNFGAFLGFMGVNLSAIRTGWSGECGPRAWRWMHAAVIPGTGFIFCLAIWLSLPSLAKIAGGTWLALGLLYLVIHTRGFRRRITEMKLAEA